jgi:hypothetical protein
LLRGGPPVDDEEALSVTRSLRFWPAAALLALATLAGGCGGEYGAIAPPGADSVSVALPSYIGGTARLYLYRITSAKTGERMGVGRTFRVEEGRQVRAVFQLDGVQADRPLHIHLMWINPEGKAAYTKEIRIRAEDWQHDDRRRALAAEMITLDPQRRFLELESRYGVSPERFEEEMLKPEDRRTFKTGKWLVRAYLFRKKVLETSFDLLPMAEAGASTEPAGVVK